MYPIEIAEKATPTHIAVASFVPANGLQEISGFEDKAEKVNQVAYNPPTAQGRVPEPYPSSD